MSTFTDTELGFLRTARLLGRLATVGPNGMPHVTPASWSLGAEEETIQISGCNFAQTKEFRLIFSCRRIA